MLKIQLSTPFYWAICICIPKRPHQVSVCAILFCLRSGIDLSMGSMLSLIGGLTVVVFNNTHNVLLTLLYALLAGLACSLINGLFTGVAKMPVFIVTLATMLIYRSITQFHLRTMGPSITARMPPTPPMMSSTASAR